MTSQFHDSMQLGCHGGRDKTYDAIKKHYIFKNMKPYITAYVESCHICQQIKSPNRKATSPLGVIEANHPWDLVSIDIWFPGCTSTQGNTCVLTIIDGFTKWAWAVPLPDHKADSVAKALFNVFSMKKWPKQLHSDCGSEFVGEVLTVFTSLFGIETSRTTAYHPQGNAYAERLHRFRQAISSFVMDDHRTWDQFLMIIMNCYNDSINTAIGTTPNIADSGSPSGFVPMHYVPETDMQVDMNQLMFVERLNYMLNKVHALIYEKIDAKIRRNLKYSENMSQTKFVINKRVMLFRPETKVQESLKLSPCWFGPYMVTQVSNNFKVYYLKDAWGDALAYPVSVLHLKRYIPQDDEDETQMQPTCIPEVEIQPTDLVEPSDRLDEDFSIPHHEFNDADEEEQEQLDSLGPRSDEPEVTRKSSRKKYKNVFIADPRSSGTRKRINRLNPYSYRNQKN